MKKFTERVKPPRSIYLNWPFGHPLGEPFNVAQQREILMEMFKAFYDIDSPGVIINLPYKWKNHSYEDHGKEFNGKNDKLHTSLSIER